MVLKRTKDLKDWTQIFYPFCAEAVAPKPIHD
jgi:hypothetical protein